MAKNRVYKENHFNDIGLKLLHRLWGIKYLHYGYFEPHQPKTIEQLPVAQENYVRIVLENFPSAPIKDVIDIGCGVGEIANQLLDRGYKVTCVDPSRFMIESTLQKTNHRIGFRNTFYENVDDLPSEGFDLILMSESAQYVDLDEGWVNHARHLKSGGHVVVADFFKVQEVDKPYLSKSGHFLDEMNAFAEKNGFELIKKVDITQGVAPTMDIYQGIIREKIFPVLEAVSEIVFRKYPLLWKICRFFFGKKITSIYEKYNHQDGATFTKYKNYFVLVWRKK